MNSEMAWFLGMLHSDGCIVRPTYRKRGNEVHLAFVAQHSDTEVLYKIKRILGTTGRVREYPSYKSPQSQLHAYDRMDIVDAYGDIKSVHPDVTGHERHFIRGVVDGDGCLYDRVARNSFSVQFMTQSLDVGWFIVNHLAEELSMYPKNPICKDNSNIWCWEGKIARLIAWYLYHGDIGTCTLSRKRDYYRQHVLRGETVHGLEELLTAVLPRDRTLDVGPAYSMHTDSKRSLEWAHRLQKVVSHDLGISSNPVPTHKGKLKYYELYVPLVNTQRQ